MYEGEGDERWSCGMNVGGRVGGNMKGLKGFRFSCGLGYGMSESKYDK